MHYTDHTELACWTLPLHSVSSYVAVFDVCNMRQQRRKNKTRIWQEHNWTTTVVDALVVLVTGKTKSRSLFSNKRINGTGNMFEVALQMRYCIGSSLISVLVQLKRHAVENCQNSGIYPIWVRCHGHWHCINPYQTGGAGSLVMSGELLEVVSKLVTCWW